MGATAEDARARAPSTDGAPGHVRSGAELVGIAEVFRRKAFVGGILTVGASALVALLLLPVRRSAAEVDPLTPTVLLTVAIAVAAPLAARHPSGLYHILRHRPAARALLVLLAAALLCQPLRSELWWPSCALLMLLATVVSVPQALAACLPVLGANLLAHVAAGDLDETPAVAVLGLWIGFPFWVGSMALLTDRVARHLMLVRVRAVAAAPAAGRRDVHPWVHVSADAVAAPGPEPSEHRAPLSSPPDPRPPAKTLVTLSERQLEVVALLADGCRYAEIAAILGISTRQVERVAAGAVAVLGAENVAHLVAIATAEGLVPPGRR